MRKLIPLIIFGILFGCSPKIKSITEYRKDKNDFKSIKFTKFDKNGNKIRIENLGNSRSNRIITTEYENNTKIFEKSCDYFKSHDTCVIRSFSKFEFDKKTGIEKQTLYEPDSAMRFIKETKRLKNLKINKIFSWEFFPTKNPKKGNAFVLTDTTFLDKKGREIKSIHYNSENKESWVEIFKYYKNGFSKQTIRTEKDTIIQFKINDLQKMANRKKIDYKFYDSENYKYVIENY